MTPHIICDVKKLFLNIASIANNREDATLSAAIQMTVILCKKIDS